MCGIAGIIKTDQAVEQHDIQRMTDALAHRGPDGEGAFLYDNVAIGHRRLAIIDLSTGKQPMCNEDESLWITFNGEIYNYRELRQQLLSHGHRFTTHSDTEVIIHAYEQWGEECVTHLRGMFAFGIVDTRQRQLFLARDHLGIKPLVYYHDEHVFAFASEMQALRQIRDGRFELDLLSIDRYLWLQYIPCPRSIFTRVSKLPPAHRMRVRFDGAMSEPERYWQINFAPDHAKTEAAWLEELDAKLRDSVKHHLVADVPFGAFLSGGIDSSAVVAYMAQLLNRPVKTFTIGFDEQEFNEMPYADIAARRWQTEHHVDIVKPDALRILPQIVTHYGEPYGDSSAVPTYYVCQMARQHVTMILSGDGGDESFAGYHSYLAWMTQLQTPRPRWKELLYPLAQTLFPWRYHSPVSSLPTLEKWLSVINYVPSAMRHQLWRKEFRSLVNVPLDVFEREFAHAREYSAVHKAQYLDLTTYLPFDILTKVDIASMIHSLEVRTPLVDKEVVEFAATMPDTLNLRANETHGAFEGKLLLKKLLEQYYPKEFLSRPKMGFGMPIQRWFAPDGALRHELNERLLGRDSRLRPFFSPAAMQRLIAQNVTGPLWLLLFLEEWLRQNT